MSADPLTEVLSAHGFTGVTRRLTEDECVCGVWLDSTKGETIPTHLAAVVRAFLASDETVERAARALYLEAENASMGFDAWPAWESAPVSRDIFRSDARAALAAATEVRP